MKRKHLFSFLATAMAAVLVFAFAACGEKPKAVEKVTVSETEITLVVGEEKTLTATVEPAEAESTITWSTSDAAVATVTDGVVKAVGEGTATVTATAANGVSGTCKVKVEKAQVAEVTVSETEITLVIGAEKTLTATVEPAEADSAITWSTSDAAVATVTDGGVVKAVSRGTATVTAAAANGVSGTCKVKVKNDWEILLENSFAQTNYTAAINQDMGLSVDNQGTPFEVYGLDIDKTVKFNPNIHTVQTETTMTSPEAPTGASMTEMAYNSMENGKGVGYVATNYGTARATWNENAAFADNEEFVDAATRAAFEVLKSDFKVSGLENTCTIFELTSGVAYDEQTKKLTLTDVAFDYHLNIGGESLSFPLTADIEVTFENGLIKSYKATLSGRVKSSAIMGGDTHSEGPGMPEYMDASGEVTATVVYGNTQITIPDADKTTMNALKATKPLKDALGYFDGDTLNFTVTEKAGATTLGTGKYSITPSSGVFYSSKDINMTGRPGYVSFSNGTKQTYDAVVYYQDDVWIKEIKESEHWYNGLSDCFDNFNFYNRRFYFGDKENYDSDTIYRDCLSMNQFYYLFTAGENKTYTATFTDYYYDGSTYSFADCLVTVTLNDSGKIASIKFNYGSNADGQNFVNVEYVFTDYGTTTVELPQEVIEKIPEEESAIGLAFKKANDNTESATVVYTHTDTETTETKTEKIDAVNKAKETSEYGNITYTEFKDNGGSYSIRSYHDAGGNNWTYSEYDCDENALREVTSIYFGRFGQFSLKDGGSERSIREFYYMFTKTGDEYVANLYYVVSNWDGGSEPVKEFIPCTVTIELDGEGRITSLKVELKGNATGEVYQYTITYGNVTVTVPASAQPQP